MMAAIMSKVQKSSKGPTYNHVDTYSLHLKLDKYITNIMTLGRMSTTRRASRQKSPL